MPQSARERYKHIYDTWVNGKSQRETGRIFGISSSRVYQIVTKHRQRLADEQTKPTSSDPLERALAEGKLSQRLFNNLMRSGYGKSFSVEELKLKLQTNTLDPFDFRDFGPDSLSRLRQIFLSQSEIEALPVFRSYSSRDWWLGRPGDK